MNNIKINNLTISLIVISGILLFSFSQLFDKDLSNLSEFADAIEKVITIITILLLVFSKWGWKLKIFNNWLVPFPNLSGTWKGKIHSDWIDSSKGETVASIPTILTIKQTFLNISCVIHTSEMTSYSFSGNFCIDDDNQIKYLIFSYGSKPKQLISERNIPHEGTGMFRIIESPQKKLTGKYWTDRKTTGEINFTFYKNELLEEMPEGEI